GEGFIAGTMAGFPLAGDFDGDGRDDLATFHNNVFFIDLAANGLAGNAEHTIAFGFPGVSERPAAADMDGDGIDDLGLFVPHNVGQTPPRASEWYFLVSNDFLRPGVAPRRVTGLVTTLNHPFTPAPLGNDLFAQFGDEAPLPVVGNFDPPVVRPVPATAAVSNNILVLGAGAGGGPHVRVIDHETGQDRFSFFAYAPQFTGGVQVATGDVNGDGVLDIITAAGPGGGPHVRVFDGRNGQQLSSPVGSFFAFAPGFGGGVY